MAGPACKVIINNGFRALSLSLERILTEPLLNGGKIPEEERYAMIQQLADLDISTYSGGGNKACLVDLMTRLEKFDVLTPDVWMIYAKAAAPTV